MDLLLDVLAESLVDTAKMLPFLFLAYLFIEYVETRHGERIEALLAGGGRWGFVPGALLGCVPQCGFSAIASNFYASRVVTLGTLMAVFLATSDEAIPLLVSMPAYWDKLVLLMVLKVLYAIAVGFGLDFVLRKALPKGLRGGYTGRADEVDCRRAGPDGLFPARGSRAGGPHSQLRRQCPAHPALCRGCPAVLQPGGRPVHRCRRGPGRALAGQPLLEAKPFHHRPHLGLRRVPWRCHAGGGRAGGLMPHKI